MDKNPVLVTRTLDPIQTFVVSLWCVCGDEHAEHNTKDGVCLHKGCDCRGFRGRRISLK